MIAYAEELIRRYANRGVLIDTNLLVMLVVGWCDPEEIGRFRRTNRYLPDDFWLLSALLQPVTAFVTTPAVLAEVSNFTGYLRDELRAQGFTALTRHVQVADERQLVSEMLVQTAAYQRFGLVDASIIAIARQGVVVLTDDLRLAIYLEESALPVINYTHLRETILLD